MSVREKRGARRGHRRGNEATRWSHFQPHPQIRRGIAAIREPPRIDKPLKSFGYLTKQAVLSNSALMPKRSILMPHFSSKYAMKVYGLLTIS
jgi:hypothetical protein